jgi:cytochrome c oxidase subunit 1
MIAISVLPFLWNVFITLRKPMEHDADPWDANSLEWATTSPPPAWNFDSLPEVHSERPWFDVKYPGVGHGATPETKPETEGASS